nr:hypothetical protein [Nocardiopsis sinuspersici]
MAAIAVIAAALVLAETVLVYVALGLAGISVLLLLGALVQGRSGGDDPDRFGTDGLGKASVHTEPAYAAAQGTHVEPEHSGRVPAPVSGPVRELPLQERHSWPAPASDDSGHEEPEYDVPRWQTPTANDWPEPDTVAVGPAPVEEEPLRRETPAEGGWRIPAQASEERVADTAPEPDPGPKPGAGDESGEHTPDASPFSYSIPGRPSEGEPEEDAFEEASAGGSGDWSEEPEEDVFGEASAGGTGDWSEEEDWGTGEEVEADAAEDLSAGGSGDWSEEPEEEASADGAEDRTEGEDRTEEEEEAADTAADSPGASSFSYSIPGRSPEGEPEEDVFEGEDGTEADEDGGEGPGAVADEDSEPSEPFSYRVPVGPSDGTAEEDEGSEAPEDSEDLGEDGEDDSAVVHAAASEGDPGSGSDDGR